MTPLKYDAAGFLAIRIEIVNRHIGHSGFCAESAKFINVHADSSFLPCHYQTGWGGSQ